jgi:hypothetical protein
MTGSFDLTLARSALGRAQPTAAPEFLVPMVRSIQTSQCSNLNLVDEA